MRRRLDEITQHGWDEAIHHALPARDRDAYRRIFDPRRADWYYMGDVAARQLALDLAAEWGGVSLRLAKLFDRVIALDSVSERAGFAQLLFEHEGLSNAVAVHGDATAIPVRPESCDLVVLLDGFECASLWTGERDPAAAQRVLLAKACSLLRPGGSLCLGVTNRRSAGSVLAALRGRGNAGSLRHSPTAYRRLLEAAGFEDVSLYAAFPSHKHPRMLVPLSDPARLAWASKLSLARRARKLSAAAKLAHRLAATPVVARLACSLSESLIIWARRPPARAHDGFARLLKERIVAEWGALGINGPRPSRVSVVQFSGNWDRGGKVNWFVFPDRAERPAIVAKIARTSADADRVRHEHEMTTCLRTLPPAVSDHIPSPFALWEMNGHAVSLQEAIARPPLSGAVAGQPAEAAVTDALRLCLPFLSGLAQCTRTDLPPGTDHPYLAQLIERALSAAESGHYPPLTRELFAGLARLALEGQNKTPFSVAHHGDMSTGDVLTDDKGGFRVIDWESGVARGLPLLDLVCLGVSAASAKGPGAVAATIQALAGDPNAAATPFGAVNELAAAYCADIGLGSAARRPLAAAALLNLMLRMPDSRLSVLQLTLPSDADPAIAAAQSLLGVERALD